jgi:hypothetical protein
MIQGTGKTKTLPTSRKLQKASSKSTEVKILKRGEFYLTPFTLDHIDEVVEHLSKENRRELKLLGHLDLRQAMEEMYETSECYICRKEGESFIMVGGLWFDHDAETPQMFAMFSDKIRENFHAMARGSKMLVSFFDQAHDGMSMTVNADYEFILDWAAWLNFEAVGVYTSGSEKYVDFVRCNPEKKNAYDVASRPVMH